MSDTAAPAAPTTSAPASEATSTQETPTTEISAESASATSTDMPATSAEQSVADGNAAVEAGEKPTEKQLKDAEKILKKYKIKVDGQEVEVDENELLKGYTKGRGAEKKFQEAAKYRKQAEDAFRLLQSQPAKVLSELGTDVRKFAEEYLAGELEKELMSPVERENMELKKKLADKEDKEKQAEQTKRQEQEVKLREAQIQDLDSKISKSLSTSGLPKTPKTVAMVASYLSDAMDMGQILEPQDVIDLVREDYNQILRDVLGATDGDNLAKLVGEDTINKIRKYDLARVKSKTPANPTNVQSTPKQETAEEKPQPKKSTRDFLDELNGRYK